MKPKPIISLSDNHRRGIGTALFVLDRMLCEVEEYARGREASSVFYVEQNALSADQKEGLLAEIARMRDALQEIKDGLGLEMEAEDVGRRIWGESSTLWEILVETKSRFLKRYGPPPEELGAYLDPRIDAVLEYLRNLTNLVRPDKK
jgi:hypothetical protein